jgi:hypothetical protein
VIIPGLRVQVVDGGRIDQVLREARRTEAPREGLHCSTIVDDMMRSQWPGKYDASSFTERERVLYFEAGNAFERLMARHLRRTIIGWKKPEPREHQGIWFSPDGWVERSRTLDEIKFTWTSLYQFLDSTKFLGYLFQGLSYAHVWQAVRIRYHVFFVNGDYRHGKKPTCMTFIVRWDSPDVPREQFRNIRQHAIDRGWLRRKAA